MEHGSDGQTRAATRTGQALWDGEKLQVVEPGVRSGDSR
jgi:hypothetical protein